MADTVPSRAFLGRASPRAQSRNCCCIGSGCLYVRFTILFSTWPLSVRGIPLEVWWGKFYFDECLRIAMARCCVAIVRLSGYEDREIVQSFSLCSRGCWTTTITISIFVFLDLLFLIDSSLRHHLLRSSISDSVVVVFKCLHFYHMQVLHECQCWIVKLHQCCPATQQY